MPRDQSAVEVLAKGLDIIDEAIGEAERELQFG